MLVKEIRGWAEEKLPPFAWQRVLFRLLPDIKEAGFFLHQLQDETILDDKLVLKFQKSFLELYHLDFLADL